MMLGRLYNYFPTFLLRHGYKLSGAQINIQGVYATITECFLGKNLLPSLKLNSQLHLKKSQKSQNETLKWITFQPSTHSGVFALIFFGGRAYPGWDITSVNEIQTPVNPTWPQIFPQKNLKGMKYLLYFPHFSPPPRLGLQIQQNPSNMTRKIGETCKGTDQPTISQTTLLHLKHARVGMLSCLGSIHPPWPSGV